MPSPKKIKKKEIKTKSQKNKELKLKAQKNKELKLKAQKAKEQKTKELKLKTQKIKEQKIKEQKTKEQKIKEQKIKEQKIKEQKIKEQKIKTQKIKEQKIKEQKIKEQKIKEQKIKGQIAKELKLNNNVSIDVTEYVNNNFKNMNCVWIPKNFDFSFLLKLKNVQNKRVTLYYRINENKNLYFDKIIKNNIFLDLNNYPTFDLKNNSIIAFGFGRDEVNVLEWALYYKLIGFNYVFIIDHLSKNPIKNQVHNVKDVFLHTITDKKYGMFESCIGFGALNILFEIMKSSKSIIWGSRLDFDEYLALYNYKNINDFLQKYQKYDLIDLKWLMFGSNYLENVTGNLLINDFTKCATEEGYKKWCYRKNPNNENEQNYLKYRQKTIKCIVKNIKYITNMNIYKHAHTLDIKNKILVETEFIHHYVHRYYNIHIQRNNIRQKAYHYTSKDEYDLYFNDVDNTYLKDKYGKDIENEIKNLSRK